MSETRPPTGLKTAGRRLWRAVVDEFDLTQAELSLLREGCRIADRLDQLDAILRADPLLVPAASGGSVKVHPAMVEARQQAIALARVLVALQIPAALDDDGPPLSRPQRRGLRGVYHLRPVEPA